MSKKVIDLRELFGLKDYDQLNERVIKELLTAIKNNQKEEFDYLRFKLSHKNLMDLGMDDTTAAKSAMLTAETMGMTKEKLLQTVQYYKTVLKKERENFALALKNQIAIQVDKKEAEIKAYQEKIAGNQRKIQQLMDEQKILEQKINETSASLQESKDKINDIKNQFNNTFDVLYKHIEEDNSLFDNIL